MDFKAHVQRHKQHIIDETKRLLRIPSVLERYDSTSETPFGKDIQAALTHMLALAKRDGFVTKNVLNHAAHIEMGHGEELLGILCHLDVVPPGEGWTHHPFHPVIRDGKLYARGAMDDKGPTMAVYFAMKFLKDLGVTSNRRVRLILGTDEETGWRGVRKYLETEEMPTFGFAPDAMFPLIYGEKGIMIFDLLGTPSGGELLSFRVGERYNVVPDHAECELSVDLKDAYLRYLNYHDFKGEVKGNTYIAHGKSVHAMQPHLGVNAAFVLAAFLCEHIDEPYLRFIRDKLAFDPYGEKLGIDMKDDEMGEFTINPGVFDYDEKTARIGIDCRYPKGFDPEAAAKTVETVASEYGLTYAAKTVIPLHYVDPGDGLVKTLLSAYRKVTGDETSEPYTIGGGTYARALDKAVAFGMEMPGRQDVAHQADEHLHIEDLLTSVVIYMEAIHALTR